MKFKERSILHEVEALGVPRPDNAVINHGSALAVRGIRPEHAGGDIDMGMDMENIQYLERTLGFVATRQIVGVGKDGTRRTITIRHDADRRFDVHRWDFSLYLYNQTGHGRLALDCLKEFSDQDEETGIWVARPELVLLTKLETGRHKDEEDVGIIRAHMGLSEAAEQDLLTKISQSAIM